MLPKTLQKAVNRSDKVLSEECFQDSDGYWLPLKPGYRTSWETHCIHEMTVRDCISQIGEVEPCGCDDCRAKQQ